MTGSRRRLLLQVGILLTLFHLIRLLAAGLEATLPSTGLVVTPARIDLNRATVPELMLLPGVGVARAEAIVLHRVRFGPFREVTDLLAVSGFGERLVDGLRPFAIVGGPRGGYPVASGVR